MANWRFTDNLYYGAQGMSIRAFLTAADNEATAFSSQFSLITLSFLCQYINKTGFRACVKELFVQQHDPLSVSYAVLPGEKALKFGYDVTRQYVCILITDYETIFNEVHPDCVVTWHEGLQWSRADRRSFLFLFIYFFGINKTSLFSRE